MSASQKSTLHAPRGLAASAGLLVAVLVAAWLPVAAVAYAISALPGVLAATVAVAVCLAAGLLALVATLPFSGSAAAMQWLAVGMLARTLVPLLVGIVLQRNVPPLADAGMIFYLLVFYLVALATETALAVARLAPSAASSGKAV